MRRSRILAISTLLLLSPFTAEVLTGATPLPSFINPLNLIILMGLYGLGALLIRESRVILHIGYQGILLIGFAYGIIEEGLAVKSFFNPYWKDIGIFGSYGRWMGVNWIWTIYLTIFHGVWSILAPILVVEALYPDIMNERWLGRKGLLLALLFFSIDVMILNIALTSYQPSIIHYLSCLVTITILVYLSRKIVKNKRIESTIKNPKQYGVYWALWAILFFTGFYIISSLSPPPIIPFLIGVLALITSLELTKEIEQTHNLLHRYWLYTGITSILLLIDILLALHNVERILASILTIIFLLVLHRRIKVNQYKLKTDLYIRGSLRERILSKHVIMSLTK